MKRGNVKSKSIIINLTVFPPGNSIKLKEGKE